MFTEKICRLNSYIDGARTEINGEPVTYKLEGNVISTKGPETTTLRFRGYVKQKGPENNGFTRTDEIKAELLAHRDSVVNEVRDLVKDVVFSYGNDIEFTENVPTEEGEKIISELDESATERTFKLF